MLTILFSAGKWLYVTTLLKNRRFWKNLCGIKIINKQELFVATRDRLVEIDFAFKRGKMEFCNKTIISSRDEKLRDCSYPITARMDETLARGFYLKRVYIRYGDAEIVFVYPQWGALGATLCRRYGLSFKQKWFSIARHIDNITLMPFTCLPRESMPIFLGVIITKRLATFALTFGEEKG